MRTELVGQLATAEFALGAAIAELSRSGGLSGALTTLCLQLHSLTSLRQQVGSATGSALAALRAEVTAAASSASALAQQATGEASASHAGDPLTRAEAARQTIENVGRQIFDDKVLDPYLQFKSKEDEEAYRKREQERKEAFNRAKALNTPEGDYRAAQIEKQQLADAKAHGADRAPQFPGLENQIDQAIATLQPHAKSAANEDRKPTKMASVDPLDDIATVLQAAGVVNTHPKTAAGNGLSHSAQRTTQDGPAARYT